MPVPYTATGRLTLTLAPTTLVHKIRLPCTIALPVVSPVSLQIRNPGGGSVLASAAAQQLWTLLRPLYAVATLAPSYLIEQNFSGVFVPIETGTTAGVGTNAGVNQIVILAIYAFKDAVGHRLRFYVPENAIGQFYHLNQGQLTAPNAALVANFFAAVNTFDIGNWAVSRGGGVIKTFSFLTASGNKRFRRKLGIV